MTEPPENEAEAARRESEARALEVVRASEEKYRELVETLPIMLLQIDAEGRVVIGGRAGPGKEVRAYLDNQLVGSVKSDSSGVWHIIPDRHVLPGLHTLRIDEVDDSGKVLARVESPFSRAEPLSIGAGDQVVVVQPGNNLWLIATRTYGSANATSESPSFVPSLPWPPAAMTMNCLPPGRRR